MYSIQVFFDRVEGEKAVLLAGDPAQAIDWPEALLPEDARPGQYLKIAIEIDTAATAAAGSRVKGLLAQLVGGQADQEK